MIVAMLLLSCLNIKLLIDIYFYLANYIYYLNKIKESLIIFNQDLVYMFFKLYTWKKIKLVYINLSNKAKYNKR
jgi:hypothetical protein